MTELVDNAENLTPPAPAEGEGSVASDGVGSRIAKPERVTDVAYRQLRDAISGLGLRPGQSIGEPTLSERLGISRNSTREALIRLEATGFVSRQAGGRWFVYAMTPQEAREIYECRAILEGAAVRRVSNRAKDGDFDPEPLHRALQRAEKATTKGDLTAASGFSDEFHVKLVAAANNQKLMSLFEMLQPQIRHNRLLMMQYRLRPEFLDENARLLDAVENGDGVAAVNRVEKIAAADLTAVLELHRRELL